MVDTPDTILLVRLQATGGNVNLWGGYLNTALQTLSRADKGYQAYTVNGDATASWSNYSASNDFSVANVKWNAGTVTAAFTLTLPNYQQDHMAWNNTLYAGTVKVSGGTGITVPAGRRAELFCDGTDFRDGAANWLSSYASPLVNNGDIVTKYTLELAIAAAGLPATAGTILNSAADTTPGYHAGKHTIAYSGDLTAAYTTATPGGDEDLLLTLTHTPYWNTPRNITNASSPVTALDRDILLCQTSTGAITVTLPATGRVQVIDVSGSAATNNITVNPPTGETIMDGSASVGMAIDLAWFSGNFTRRPSGTNWSVS